MSLTDICCNAAFADTGDKLTFAQLHRLPESERDYVMGLHFNTCVLLLWARYHQLNQNCLATGQRFELSSPLVVRRL
jgi:hypothetical protein